MNINNTVDIDEFISHVTDVVSQEELYITDSVVIDVESLIGEITDLISLPEVYLRIRELMDDPNSCLEDFSAVVSTDPALIASVLKIVNSAFFGFTGQIDNITRALNLIGTGPLHDLVLSLSALDSLDLSNDVEAMKLFWKRNIYCGAISRLIAEKLRLQNSESLFVVGLLHEIGRLVLFQKYPQQSRQNMIQAKTDHLPLSEVEKITFGTDYALIGQALMAEWNLPYKFQCITGHHPNPEKATEYIDETTIIYVAHHIAANKFTDSESFQFVIEAEKLAALKISTDELDTLCIEADSISLGIEKVILGKLG